MRHSRGENLQPGLEGQIPAEGAGVSNQAEDPAVERQAGKSLSSRIESLRARVREILGRDPKEAERQVRELKEAETEQRGGVVDRLLDRFRIRRTQNEVFFLKPDISPPFATDKTTTAAPEPLSESAVEERVGEDLALLAETKGAVQMQTEVDELAGEVEAGLEKQGPAELSEAERKKRDVATIAREYGVTFVHALRPGGMRNPDDNSILREGVDWDQKLDIVLTLEPPIACSTLKPGDTKDNLWHGMGVILNGGSVDHAGPTDAGSVSDTVGGRTNDSGLDEDIGSQVTRAIKDRPENDYNEFNIRDPKVAGLFVCREPGFKYSEDISFFPDEALAAKAERCGLPLFVVVAGEVWHGQFDVGTRKIRPTRLANLDEIHGQPGNLPPEQKDLMLEKLFEDNPFNLDKIGCAEAQYVDSRFYGWQTAVELLAASAAKSIDQLALHGVNKRVEYSLRDGQAWQRAEFAKTRAQEGPLGQGSGLEWGTINFGSGTGTIKIGEKIRTADEYLDGMRALLEKQRKEIVDLVTEAYPGQRQAREKILATMGYHLHGFGEQAEQMGNHELAARAFSLAQPVVPRQECQDVVRRRVGPDGKFRITRKDLNLPEDRKGLVAQS